MTTLTQSQLDNLKLAVHQPNGPASKDYFWNNRDALIAAAEEGLALRKQLEAEAVYQSGLRDERDSLRARVQELEEAIDKIQALARDREIGEEQVNLMRIEQVIDALSNSTPQRPRYTLEDGIKELERKMKEVDDSKEPLLASAYGLAVCALHLLKQKEGA